MYFHKVLIVPIVSFFKLLLDRKTHEAHQIASVHWNCFISAELSHVGSDYCFQCMKQHKSLHNFFLADLNVHQLAA